MFNLFVHWEEGGFDSLAYVIEKERFGEYTSEKLLKRFIGLNPAAKAKLKTFPTLVVYEGLRGDARVAFLKDIRERDRSIVVEFEFDSHIPAFPGSRLSPATRIRLDIKNFEMSRTHWAIKDEDLLKILASEGLSRDSKDETPGTIEGVSRAE